MSDYTQRFGGIARLVSVDGLERLRRAHVCVVGIGGVGCWAVEALARSGIGQLTLVDLDELCVTNVNRQLHALTSEIGEPKVEAMARRVKEINPECNVHAVQEFFGPENADRILESKFDYMVDAIDAVAKKCLLIARCKENGVPVITTGGAGGRADPTQIRVVDLALTTHDRLLQHTRKMLRDDFGFPDVKTKFGVDCVYSPEPQVFPQSDGTICATREPGTELQLDCNSGYGTATFVTGTFGFVVAAEVVKKLVSSGP